MLVNNDSTYLLKLNDKSNTEESGTYQIENKQITFSPNNNNFVWYCQLEKETLNCNSYAEKFEKSQIEHNKEIAALNRKIADLNQELADSDNKYTKVFNVENSRGLNSQLYVKFVTIGRAHV